MTKVKENSAMVNVMFACFMLMFAVTAMDIKKNVLRDVLDSTQIPAGVSLEHPQPSSAGRLSKRSPAAAAPGMEEVDAPMMELSAAPGGFWESAAGIPAGNDPGDLAVRIDIKPLEIDEEDPMHP